MIERLSYSKKYEKRERKGRGLDRGGGGGEKGGDGGGGAVVFGIAEDALAEVGNHKGKALPKGHRGLPTKKVLSFGNIGFSFVWVVFCVWPELYPCIWIYCLLYYLHITRILGNKLIMVYTLP